jgi:hypothetical protein
MALPKTARAQADNQHMRLTERIYTNTKTGRPTTMDTSAIGKQSESLRGQSLRYCIRAVEEAGRCVRGRFDAMPKVSPLDQPSAP